MGALHEIESELTDDEIEVWRQREAARIERALQAGKTSRARKAPKHRIELFLDPPKNRTSAREVDVPPFLVRKLTQHLKTWEHEYAFFTPGGQWWRRGNFTRQQLRPAADGRLALPASRGHAPREAWEPILPGFTMRGARHTHDTWMKEDRVDRALRFSTMGWAVADIEGTYEHVTPQMGQDRLAALQARWERAGQAVQAT
ncbi:hypothetical protein GCM10010430_03360 [Kitasatospora cystarginea]|uniref:Integrase n=1 Tax=Kitasatospora cystarginea TaxID=58350 RepID=A0ABN3DCS0_9ACTN